MKQRMSLVSFHKKLAKVQNIHHNVPLLYSDPTFYVKKKRMLKIRLDSIYAINLFNHKGLPKWKSVRRKLNG